MTGPEHYREAERLTRRAGTWMEASTGWKGRLPDEQRLAYRMADLAEAQVHATLAKAAATALSVGPNGRMPLADYVRWHNAAGFVDVVEEG